jgi:hypothetical protein
MKVYSLFVLFLVICVSCKKNDAEKPKPSPGPFYARFKINDSAVSYTNNTDYYFEQGRGTSTDGAGHSEYFPTTFISPVARQYSNVNVYYSFGQVFSYTPTCPDCIPSFSEFGDALFVTGPRGYCYTGINFVAEQLELACSDNHRMSIYLNSKQGNLLNSGSAPQPAWSYYSIDTVTIFHMREATLSSGSYDKIISGRFACRVFNPLDTADHLDITEGVFRMPIWLDAPY